MPRHWVYLKMGLPDAYDGSASALIQAAPPGLVVMAPDAKQSRGQASNDDHLEAMESPKSDAGGEVDQVIDMTECLTWIGDTIEEQLDREPGLPPTPDSP